MEVWGATFHSLMFPNVHLAGKSTLLQILAGKKLIAGADVRIKGRDVFHDSPAGVTFLGTEWSVPFSGLNSEFHP